MMMLMMDYYITTTTLNYNLVQTLRDEGVQCGYGQLISQLVGVLHSTPTECY